VWFFRTLKWATMQPQEPSSQPRRPGVLSTIKGSLLIAAVVLFWDVGCEGFYTWSVITCLPWLLISGIKNAIQRPGWGIAVLRVAMPLLTFAIAYGNANLQWKISDANAQRVIKACEEFRVANGRYPGKLDELVPKYLSSVPPAKYCLFMDNFWYVNRDGLCMLWWTRYGFYRRIYHFDEKRWGNVD
jgi:hypothetical protein